MIVGVPQAGGVAFAGAKAPVCLAWVGECGQTQAQGSNYNYAIAELWLKSNNESRCQKPQGAFSAKVS